MIPLRLAWLARKAIPSPLGAASRNLLLDVEAC